VAGDLSVPSSWWEGVLVDRLRLLAPTGAPIRIRWIRREGSRAIVEVDHLVVAAAREAWNIALVAPNGRPVQIATKRSWGTLRGAKAWLRRPRSSAGSIVPGRDLETPRG
jgi:hypothetical protein